MALFNMDGRVAQYASRMECVLLVYIMWECRRVFVVFDDRGFCKKCRQ